MTQKPFQSGQDSVPAPVNGVIHLSMNGPQDSMFPVLNYPPARANNSNLSNLFGNSNNLNSSHLFASHPHSAPVKHTNSGVYNLSNNLQDNFMPQFTPQQQRLMDYNTAINNIKRSLTELQNNLSKTYSKDKFAG